MGLNKGVSVTGSASNPHHANCEHLAQLLVLAKPKKLSKLAWPCLVTSGCLFFFILSY